MPTHRRAKKHTQIEKLYANYQVAGPVPAAQTAVATPKGPQVIPILSPEEARFVRRDLARVGISALIALLIILAVYLWRFSPGWEHLVTWVGHLTNF